MDVCCTGSAIIPRSRRQFGREMDPTCLTAEALVVVVPANIGVLRSIRTTPTFLEDLRRLPQRRFALIRL